MSVQVRVHADAAELERSAVGHIEEAVLRAVAERGRALLVLAGGSTPLGVYRRLAAGEGAGIDWSRVHLFWGDERCVGAEDPHSNFGAARAALLASLPVPPARVHRIRGEEGASAGAALLDAELRRFFDAPSPATLPSGTHAFDLVLLGIGDDGHTASLFPHSPALHATAWAAPAEAPPGSPVAERVTLTLPAINASRECLFLATGRNKRDAVRAALDVGLDQHAPPPSVRRLPATGVRPRGPVTWLLDRAAAGEKVHSAHTG